MYYIEVSTNLYKNLGFEEVLESKNESSVRFPVYLYENINQKEGIELINAITKESGWKSLKPIHIVFNDQVISVDRILRHPVDKLNFHCKKQHILRVIKCIYTEIMFKYYEYVIFILSYCEMRYVKCNDFIYINLVRQIFDAVHESTKMFEVMYKTLVSLNKLIGEYIHDNWNSNLKCLCSLINKLLEEINSEKYSIDVLDSKSDIIEQSKNLYYASTSVKNITKFLKYHKSKHRTLNASHEKHCRLRNLSLNIDIPNSINTETFSSACNKLIVFSENVIKVYYEELGLNKFN
ncbi:uncharacterized protein LOC126910395 [Daktulosphaira vitifoliae]|uniref:uncharacterized protein LOC126910395 n=1 Tax=Daktulosphaira vitifoliae TaxID=58002 RepID=UPI0021AAF4FF|nr:uncharacterized protein LOC126910395 [Daktulosphaira vitifoliae]